ncbi:MAG: thiamine pyrophosphate-binding protein [Nitrospirota bacterium]|nr:thiamine pyrophosphate-binding protein [Nitrospirota bacterium]
MAKTVYAKGERAVSSWGPREEPYEATDLILSYVNQLGIKCVFGVPGGAVEPMFNAMARSEAKGGARVVVARNECGAAFMADGYARESGGLGVCVATTGPGATNMLTGVASAYQDRIPLLVITAQTALPTFGRGAIQESSCTAIDTTSIFRHCTKYSTLVSHIEQLEHKLASAITVAMQEPKGPVHLSIPLDLQRAKIVSSEPKFDLTNRFFSPALVDPRALDDLAGRLLAAHRVTIIAGEGCTDAGGSLLRLAERIHAKVVTTPQGKGVVSPYHPLYQGVFGLAGHASAHDALADPEVDLVLAVGTALDEIANKCWDENIVFTPRLVHLDSDAGNFKFTPMARMHVPGNIQATVDHLICKLGIPEYGMKAAPPSSPASGPQFDAAGKSIARRRDAYKLWMNRMNESYKCIEDTDTILPQRLMFELSTRFPQGTRFLADIGNSFLWSLHYLHPYESPDPERHAIPGGHFRTSMGFSSMGWAIGGAVGTTLARPGTPVVCIVGDGSLLMNGQELSVAVAERIPVVFVVLNDASLGTVKHGQRLAGAEQVGWQLPQVDFVQYARSMGATAQALRTPADFDCLDVDAMLLRRGPTLLDVYIDPEEVPPMRMRMASLGTGVGE